MKTIKLISTTIFFILSFSVNAATWTFSNVEFFDGATLTGSFDYDNGIFSNVSIVTESSGQLGNIWDDELDFASSDSMLFYFSVENEWEHYLSLSFSTSLGGQWHDLDSGLTTLQVGGVEQWTELNGGNGDEYRALLGGGSIVLSTVPVPAAVWLFGSGLLGLVGLARRKKTA